MTSSNQTYTLCALAVLIAVGGCDRKTDSQSSQATSAAPSSSAQTTRRVEVQVNSAGEIRVDSVLVSLDQVDKRFAKLAGEGGEVWYYREAPLGEPPPNAMRVIELVVKHRLPLSMSSKPDFSDYIDENGQSQPRK